MTERRGKYNASRVEVDGFRFDSYAESQRYQDLLLLSAAGDITDLTPHPRFLLQGGFEYDGKKERPIYYEADSQYRETDTGAWIVEDVKGVRTEVYKIKRKLFLKLYGHLYTFKEIGV